MDLQVSIIRCRARLTTCNFEIRIFNELIKFLHGSWRIRESPPRIAPFAIVDKSPHTQRMSRCIKQTNDRYRRCLQCDIRQRLAGKFQEVVRKRKSPKTTMAGQLHAQ
jgi:hypothetical protein